MRNYVWGGNREVTIADSAAHLVEKPGSNTNLKKNYRIRNPKTNLRKVNLRKMSTPNSRRCGLYQLSLTFIILCLM